MIWRVRLEPQWFKNSERYASEIYENVKGRPNPTGVEADRRYEKGYLGEFATVQGFRERGVETNHYICTNGRSQPAEIQIRINGRSYWIDSKALAGPWYYTAMVFEIQAQNLDCDYVAVPRLDLEGFWAEIMGFAPKADVLKWELRNLGKGWTRTAPFSDLIDPDDFLETLRMGLC